MGIEQPWLRPKDPTPIPEGDNVSHVLRSLGGDDFNLLIRDNLTAWENLPGGRVRWERLWAALADDDELQERSLGTLHMLRRMTELAVQSGALNAAGQKRTARFLRSVDHAAARLIRKDERALSWAGRAADGFNPPARVVIERLVLAISGHRDAFPTEDDPSDDDEDLWAVLDEVGLDPQRLRRARRRG